MNGSLTLLDDNLLYIAFSISGLSGKNEQKMKFRGRGVGQRPNRSLNHDDVYIEDCKGERKCVFCEKGSSTLFIAIGKGGTFRSFIL